MMERNALMVPIVVIASAVMIVIAISMGADKISDAIRPPTLRPVTAAYTEWVPAWNSPAAGWTVTGPTCQTPCTVITGLAPTGTVPPAGRTHSGARLTP